MSRVFTIEIDGSTCIGNSLSTINDNFYNLDVGLMSIDNLSSTFLTAQTLPIASKGTAGTMDGTLGAIRVGTGLTVDSGTGVVGLERNFTFTDGISCDGSARVFANVDNITTGVDDHGYLVSLPSPQDLWVIANSSYEMQATAWVKANSAALMPAFAPDNYDIIIIEFATRGSNYTPAVYGGEYGNVLVAGATYGNDGAMYVTVYGTIFHRYPYTISINSDSITQIAGYGFGFTSLSEGSYTATIYNTYNNTTGSFSFNIDNQTSPTTSALTQATLILKK